LENFKGRMASDTDATNMFFFFFFFIIIIIIIIWLYIPFRALASPL
jgi:hypothetical protein